MSLLRIGLMVWGLSLTLVMVARVIGKVLPEGAQLAFSAIEPDMTITIYLYDLTRRLTVPLVFDVDRTLSFSPTRQLIFSQPTHDEEYAVFRWHDGETVQLSPDGVRDRYPAWSPDGTQVAFLSFTDELSTLTIMNADGSQRRALANEGCPNIRTIPIWLPDSQRIMFRYGDDQVQLACVIDTVSGETWDFAHDTNIPSLPAWSPDGTRIAFAIETPNFANIYSADITQNSVSNIGQLTQGTNDFNTNPRWSPDGAQIAFISNRSGNREIYVMNADGSGVRNVSQSNANDFFPLWSPDSTQLAFISNEEGDWGITMNAVDGTSSRRITYRFRARPILMVWLGS